MSSVNMSIEEVLSKDWAHDEALVKGLWWDWFCPEKELFKRGVRLLDRLSEIADSPLFDKRRYLTFFKQICPSSYRERDYFYIMPMDKGKELPWFSLCPPLPREKRGTLHVEGLHADAGTYWYSLDWREITGFFATGTPAKCMRRDFAKIPGVHDGYKIRDTAKGRLIVEVPGFEDGGRTLATFLPALAADFVAQFECSRGAEVAVLWKDVQDGAAFARAEDLAWRFGMFTGLAAAPAGWNGEDVERVVVAEGPPARKTPVPGGQGVLPLDPEEPSRRVVPCSEFRGFYRPVGEPKPGWRAEAVKTETWKQFSGELLRWSLASNLDGTKRGFRLVPPCDIDAVRDELRQFVGHRFFDALQLLTGGRSTARLCKLDGDARQFLASIRAHGPAIAEAYRSGRFSKVVAEARRIETERRQFDKAHPECLDPGNRKRFRKHLCTQLNAGRILAVFLGPILPQFAGWTGWAFRDEELDWDSIGTPCETGRVELVPAVEGEDLWNESIEVFVGSDGDSATGTGETEGRVP